MSASHSKATQASGPVRTSSSLRRRRELADEFAGQVPRVNVTTPSAVPTSSTSAGRRANRPTVTTPAIWLISVSSATGSAICRARARRGCDCRCRSRPPRASAGWPPSRSSCARHVSARHRDHLDRQREAAEPLDELGRRRCRRSGAMRPRRSSRGSARAPPPLISAAAGRPRRRRRRRASSSPVAFRSRTGMPCGLEPRALASELETAPPMRPRMARQRLDEEVDGRAGADADHRPGVDVSSAASAARCFFGCPGSSVFADLRKQLCPLSRAQSSFRKRRRSFLAVRSPPLLPKRPTSSWRPSSWRPSSWTTSLP